MIPNLSHKKSKSQGKVFKIMGWRSDCLVLDLAVVGAHVTVDIVAIVALLPSGPLDVPISTVIGVEFATF